MNSSIVRSLCAALVFGATLVTFAGCSSEPSTGTTDAMSDSKMEGEKMGDGKMEEGKMEEGKMNP